MKKICAVMMVAACARPALAVDIKAGDWTVGLGGIVNAYYTGVSCSGDDVGGLALGGRALGCGGEDRRTTIGNGLLPNGLLASAASTQGGFDVTAKIGIYSATATDSAISQNSNVDVRQAFFTFGRANLGTFKLGRDYGIFGANAILGDMTLVGAGARCRRPSAAASRWATSAPAIPTSAPTARSSTARRSPRPASAWISAS
jgi:hypothetical protein